MGEPLELSDHFEVSTNGNLVRAFYKGSEVKRKTVKGWFWPFNSNPFIFPGKEQTQVVWIKPII